MKKTNAKDLLLENLRRLRDYRTREGERRLFALSEMAKGLYQRMRQKGFAACFEEGRYTADQVEGQRIFFDGKETVEEYRPMLYGMVLADESMDIAAFSLFLAEYVAEMPDFHFPWQDPLPKEARVCFIRAGLAEDAYAIIAAARSTTLVSYAENADDAAALVAAGKSDYALLPLASGSERLSTIEKVTERHDLTLSAVVRLGDEDHPLLYGLFSSVCAPFIENNNTVFELKLTGQDLSHLGRMLAVLPVFGFSVESFSSVSGEYGRAGGRVCLAGKGNHTALWFYLSFYARGFTVLGRYPILP